MTAPNVTDNNREAHPVAGLFPMLDAAELDGLACDIAANGLRDPIWLHEGKIVDGRNRYAACRLVGVEPRFREWDGCGSLVGFVVSLNLHRRHLSSSQRAMVATDIEPLLAAEAKERMARGGRAAAPGRPAADKGTEILPDLSPPTPITSAPSGEAREQAAKLVKTNARYVSDAKKLVADAPALAEKVRAGEITIPEAKKEIRQQAKAAKVAEIAAQEPAPLAASGPFDVLYVDPPWRYEHAEPTRQIENHYPTMSLDEIKAIQVPAAADCVLFLWATSPKLAESMEVLTAWGFDYRTCMVWVKDKIGMGYYARQQHELLLIAKRGNPPVPDPSDRPSSVVTAPRVEHSAKPDEFYDLIERMYPTSSYGELFARRPRNRWGAWGNQA